MDNAAVLCIRYSTRVDSSGTHCPVPPVQTNLLCVPTPAHIAFWRILVSLDLCPVRVIPLPYVSSITLPTALLVHLISLTHQGGAGTKRPCLEVTLSYFSDEYRRP